jgi:acyl-CoA thioesterase-1
MAAVLGVVRSLRSTHRVLVALGLFATAAACSRGGGPSENGKVEAAAPERKAGAAPLQATPAAPPAAAPVPDLRKTVLVFGDSLSAGYGLRQGEAWPALLQARLGAGFKVVNASVSGETTAGGLTRLPAALLEHRPAIVILELGGNDGLRGLPLDLAEKNLAAMIERAQGAGAKVLLVSLQLPPNLGERYTGQFQALFGALARRYHLPAPPFLLEGVADKRELFQGDQIHPVASAQPQLVDNVYPALVDLARN